MQNTDPAWMRAADARALFRRARGAGVWWVSGTEFTRQLRQPARAAGYLLTHRGGDVWIALDPARAVPGSISAHWHQDIAGVAHRHPDRGVLRVTFRSAAIGWVSVLAAHYDLVDASNLPIAADLGRTAVRWGQGRRLVLAGVDTNMHLRRVDPWFGRPLSTVWSRLGHYEPTHCCGETIDTLATYDRDTRDVPAWCHAILGWLHTDHWVVAAGFRIRALT